jgi:hypothetical protein
VQEKAVIPLSFLSKTAAFDWSAWFLPSERPNVFRWFDAYVMATLSRECKYPENDQVIGGIMEALNCSDRSRIYPALPTFPGASLWKFGPDKWVYAIAGTPDISAWVGYALGTLQANTNWPATDMAQYYSAFHDYMNDTDQALRTDKNWRTPNGAYPTKVYTGHSLGGMLANFLQNWHNNSQTQQPPDRYGDVSLTYSFAAPAYARWKSTWNLSFKHTRQFRVVAPPDPVPDMVQIACQADPFKWTWWYSPGPTLIGVPWHVETLRALALPLSNVTIKLSAMQSAAPWDWPAIMGTFVDAHKSAYYCNQIAVVCEALTDTPEPTYSELKQVNATMDALDWMM